MILASDVEPNAGRHHCRCCSATIVHTCSACAKACARNNASRKSEYPPRREQNCFGTAIPDAFVVKLCSRRPSPAANTIAQVTPVSLIARYSLSLIFVRPAVWKHPPVATDTVQIAVVRQVENA
jgi:hypothetical protein